PRPAQGMGVRRLHRAAVGRCAITGSAGPLARNPDSFHRHLGPLGPKIVLPGRGPGTHELPLGATIAIFSSIASGMIIVMLLLLLLPETRGRTLDSLEGAAAK